MHFPQFWAKHTENGMTCWRWSDTSPTEAESLAAEAAHRCAEAFASGGKLQRYGYPDRPLREQVLEQIKNSAGRESALVTRNSYGCNVLNVAQAMFVDIDIPEEDEGAGNKFALPSFIRRLLGLSVPASPPTDNRNPAVRVLAKVSEWTRCHEGWGWRVYRTKAGLRLLAVHNVFDPLSPQVETVFQELGADPLYARLCKVQECFRARLSPKPWRCGSVKPPAGWPWSDADSEQAYRKWERDYQRESAQYATCLFVGLIGNETVHPDVQPLIAFHDKETRATMDLPLA